MLLMEVAVPTQSDFANYALKLILPIVKIVQMTLSKLTDFAAIQN